MSDEHSTPENVTPVSPAVTNGLSYIGGIGLVTIFITLGIAVVAPPENPNIVGIFVLGGLLLLISAIVGWFMVVQPQKHFDDINVPLEEEHH